MTVTVIGIGLIGGSFALALKDKGLAESSVWSRMKNIKRKAL